MKDQSLYQLQSVQKRHGSNFLLEVRHLDVRRGEVLGLLGPTGAGKSTLLRLLAGLEKPTGGEIHFDHSPFVSTNLALATRRRITMVHQGPVLLRGTVRLNIEYGLRLRGFRDRTRNVDTVLDQLGLARFADQSAQTLSRADTACRSGTGNRLPAGGVAAR